jgi:hypothetical protein
MILRAGNATLNVDNQSSGKTFRFLFRDRVNGSLLIAIALLTTLELTSYLSNVFYSFPFSTRWHVVYKEVDLSWLAMITWLCWTSPASFAHRCSFVIFMIFYCWLQSSMWVSFGSCYLGYGCFVATHAVVSDLIGLRGWHSNLQLTSQPKSPGRFSIFYILALMSLVASLCVLSPALPTTTDTNTMLFLIATVALATAAVFIQHAFTAENKNILWACVGFIVVVAGAGLITLVRSVNPDSGYTYSIFGSGGFLLVRYWFDIVAFMSFFIALVAIFAATAGLQMFGQRIRPFTGSPASVVECEIVSKRQ